MSPLPMMRAYSRTSSKQGTEIAAVSRSSGYGMRRSSAATETESVKNQQRITVRFIASFPFEESMSGTLLAPQTVDSLLLWIVGFVVR